ncbi:hypothetical protein VPH35_137176 [Triticum aestivum]
MSISQVKSHPKFVKISLHVRYLISVPKTIHPIFRNGGSIVYKLLKLVLILPVATASVERVFSSMSYVKNKVRNKMGDDYLNNCLVTFVEREFFNQVKDEDVINLFQKGDRRVIL